jgi:hypothetical protein
VDLDGMSDEPLNANDQPDQDELSAEILRLARRSESRRLERIYNDIISEGLRQQPREQEDREWQLAAKREDAGQPGWEAVLKRGIWFGLPLLVGPPALVLIGDWLLPQALHRLNPSAVGDLVAVSMLLSLVAFLIGVLTAK